MPGPSSLAITTTPWRPASSNGLRTISPRPTCTTMLRATSEIAVAISVGSGRGKPSRSAMARPSARAVTRSASVVMATRTSSSIHYVPLSQAIEERDRLVEVERHAQRLQVETELHHCDRHIGLDADDDRRGAAQARGEDDRAPGSGHEGVDHVERRDVDHDPAGAMPPDHLGELMAEL